MITINVGVTGHRDIKKTEYNTYKKQAKNLLTELINKYPSSKIQVLSGLAEGADMLVAEVALELGCNLVCVLPMPKEEYIKTFSSNENLPLFEELLLKSTYIVDVSKIYNTNIEQKDYTTMFSELGVYIVKNSQILIALWDGLDAQNVGGTSTVVEFALKGLPYQHRTSSHILDSHDCIMVYHILVARENSNNSVQNKLEYLVEDYSEYKILYSNSWTNQGIKAAKDYYNSILIEIDTYNNDALKVKEEDILRSISYVLNEEEQKDIPIELNEILREFAISDNLALMNQKKTIYLLKNLLFCGFLVFFWVTLFDEILPDTTNILLLVPISFAITYIIYKLTIKKKVENKYYEYRALSESLRVQLFWKLQGLKINAYECYSKKNRYDLGWITSALSNISLKTNFTIANTTDKVNKYKLIYTNWINDQLTFYKKRYKQTVKKIKRHKTSILTFFILGISSVLLMYIIAQLFSDKSWFDNGKSLCLFSIDIFLAIGAMLSGYVEKRQYDTQNNQYQRMAMLFSEGISEYLLSLDAMDYEKLDILIKDIGVEALAENCDWVSYNRANSIDLPLG